MKYDSPRLENLFVRPGGITILSQFYHFFDHNRKNRKNRTLIFTKIIMMI